MSVGQPIGKHSKMRICGKNLFTFLFNLIAAGWTERQSLINRSFGSGYFRRRWKKKEPIALSHSTNLAWPQCDCRISFLESYRTEDLEEP